jgi:hypothetical protein
LKFPSGLHCEFILAAFLLYPKEANPVKDELLLKIAQVLLSSTVFTHWITNHHITARLSLISGGSASPYQNYCVLPAGKVSFSLIK